jgi:hypothetical protein
MEASGRPRRVPRLRLWLLTAVAFVGYEFVIYRHWVTSVPLIPSGAFEVPRDWAPLRLISSGELVLARRLSLPGQPSREVIGRVVEFRSFPEGNRVGQRTTPGDSVATPPIKSGVNDYLFNDFNDERPLSYRRDLIAQHTFSSSHRSATCYCLDRRRDLCLIDDTLQCYDSTTDRALWSISRVGAVVSVHGNFAFVNRLQPDRPFDTRRMVPALVSLSDGHLEERVFPEDARFELSDFSPDGRLMLYRTGEAFELWSIESRSRIWTKSITELRTRELMFSNDGQSLVYRSLDENGRFQSLACRALDGEPLTTDHEPADPGNSLIPPSATSGSRYAFFFVPFASRQNSELAIWLSRMAMRARLFVTPAPHSRQVTLFDVEAGQPLGTVDVTDDASLMMAPDASRFAVYRPGSSIAPQTIQFYTLPPRVDWPWWSIRAIGLPVAIVLLVIALPRIQRRRRLKQMALTAASSPRPTESVAKG